MIANKKKSTKKEREWKGTGNRIEMKGSQKA